MQHAPTESTAETRSRADQHVAYIDGLRGVAIAMVLGFHAWIHYIQTIGIPEGRVWWYAQIILPHGRPYYEGLLSRGYQGVSLFLVISGFCLSYPLWRRREGGQAAWFSPSQFFARRCLRILPPYYVALVFFLIVDIGLAARGISLQSSSLPSGRGDLLTQLLLVHNIMPGQWVNASFWSLGLEWQWYLLFPAILLLCARSPVIALPVCFSVAVGWFSVMAGTTAIVLLPYRLFEFCCGMVVAWLLVRGVRLSTPLLLLGTLLAIGAAEACPFLTSLGLHQPLYGLGFSGLLLLGSQSERARVLLSWRPLVRLGVVSYSVYLVHEPLIELIERIAPLGLAGSPWVMAVAAAFGLAGGVAFYWSIERPCTSKRVRAWALPALTRLFRWMGWRPARRRPLKPAAAVQHMGD